DYVVPAEGAPTVIEGTHGSLTIKADGSYSYVANPNTGGKSDSFEFVITDGDGDTATATIDVSITAATGPDPDAVGSVEVNESGLTSEADTSEFAEVAVPAGYTIVSGGEGNYGKVHEVDGKWQYELTTPYGHSEPDTAAGADTVEITVRDEQ